MDTLVLIRRTIWYISVFLFLMSCARNAQMPASVHYPEESVSVQTPSSSSSESPSPTSSFVTPIAPPASTTDTLQSTIAVRGVNNALNTILEKAAQYKQKGQLPQAASTLERGIKINPDAPVLWQRLAEIKLLQGNYEQAEQLALKSNSLTADSELHQINLAIIQQAHSKKGKKK